MNINFLLIPFQNPSVYIGSLRLDEPVSVFTDLIFVALCIYAFFKTKAQKIYVGPNLYRWFILLTGLSTLVAAIVGHLFFYYFGAGSKIFGWVLGVGGLSFAQFGAIYHTRKVIGERVFKLLFYLNCIEVAFAYVLTFVFNTFLVVEIHTAYGLLLVVTVLESIYFSKTKSVLSKRLIIGVCFAVGAVLVHVLKLAFSVWFNHLDLSHIFMIASFYFIYIGLKDYKAVKTV